MATSFFFNNKTYRPEQNLIQNLANEMIKIYGIDIYYIIRNTNQNNIDPLLDQAPTSYFEIAVPIEMYINSYDGFLGQGDLLTKFGLDVADKLVVSVSRTRFAEDIGSQNNLIRPREGDLIYFPLSNGIFEIKFVEHEAAFYQRGALQYFELQCEKYSYNNEIFNTGIPAIDIVQAKYSVADDNFEYETEDSYYIMTEDSYDIVNETDDLYQNDNTEQNEIFTQQANVFVDFTITNPFGDII